MPLVDLTSAPLPNDDENADASDVSLPIQAILAVVNGHIDTTNIEPGGLAWSVMASFTNEIAATAMEDDANLKIYRDEANIGFVASGCVWSATSGLNGAMTAGVIYGAEGSRSVVAAVVSKTFTASKDTYIDISPAGSVNYTEVANGAASPSLASNYLRVAKVITSGSAVTSVKIVGHDTIGNPYRPAHPVDLADLWVDYTPVWAGLNPATATVTARYTRVGKIVKYRITLVWNSAPSFSGNVIFTLPVPSASYVGSVPFVGNTSILDSGSFIFGGPVVYQSSTTANARVFQASNTYLNAVQLSATVPMTWAATDELVLEGEYECV